MELDLQNSNVIVHSRGLSVPLGINSTGSGVVNIGAHAIPIATSSDTIELGSFSTSVGVWNHALNTKGSHVGRFLQERTVEFFHWIKIRRVYSLQGMCWKSQTASAVQVTPWQF